MASYGIEIENTDGTFTQVGAVLGIGDPDAAKAAARARIARRRDTLDPDGRVAMREKDSGTALFADGEKPTVTEFIA